MPAFIAGIAAFDDAPSMAQAMTIAAIPNRVRTVRNFT